MSVPFYMDHQIKAAITQGLRQRSVDVITCAEDGTDQADDEPILERATQLGRAVFTQDVDFLVLASKWLRSRRDFAGVVYAEQMGIAIGQAIHHHNPSRNPIARTLRNTTQASTLNLLTTLLSAPAALSPGWLRVDPTFAALHGDPRFERLAAGAGH